MHKIIISLIAGSFFSLVSFAIQIECNFSGYNNKIITLVSYYGDELLSVDENITDNTGFTLFKPNPEKCGLYKLVFENGENIPLYLSPGTNAMQLFASYPNVLTTVELNGDSIQLQFIKYQNAFNNYLTQKRERQAEVLRFFTDRRKTDSLRNLIDAMEKEYKQMVSSVFIRKNYAFSSYIQLNTALDNNLFHGVIDTSDVDRLFNEYPFVNSCLLNTPLYSVVVSDFLGAVKTFGYKKQFTFIKAFLNNTTSDSACYQFYLTSFYNYFNKQNNGVSEYVFCHIAREFYIDNKPWWSNDNLIASLTAELNTKEQYLLGNNLQFPSYLEREIKKAGVSTAAEYSLYAFIDNNCDHCLEELSKARSILQNSLSIQVVIIDLGAPLGHNSLGRFPFSWHKISVHTFTAQLQKDMALPMVPVFFYVHNGVIQAKGNNVKTVLTGI